MTALYSLAAIIGAGFSAFAVWSHGLVDVVIAAPLGGSLAALAASGAMFVRGIRRTPAHRPHEPIAARFSRVWTAAAQT